MIKQHTVAKVKMNGHIWLVLASCRWQWQGHWRAFVYISWEKQVKCCEWIIVFLSRSDTLIYREKKSCRPTSSYRTIYKIAKFIIYISELQRNHLHSKTKQSKINTLSVKKTTHSRDRHNEFSILMSSSKKIIHRNTYST